MVRLIRVGDARRVGEYERCARRLWQLARHVNIRRYVEFCNTCMAGLSVDCRDWSLPRALACSGRVVTAAPAIDEAHVGSGNDAQLGGALVHGGVRPGVVTRCQALPRVPGQEICPPGSEISKFSERRGLALRGGRAAGGVPAAYVRDLGQHLLIGAWRLHRATIEQAFDRSWQ